MAEKDNKYTCPICAVVRIGWRKIVDHMEFNHSTVWNQAVANVHGSKVHVRQD